MIWTTFNNSNSCFDHWEENLDNLGFGMQAPGDVVMKVHLPDNKKAWISNLDVSTITLNGNKSQRGGRPSVACIDWGLTGFGEVTSKTSQSTLWYQAAMHLVMWFPLTYNSQQMLKMAIANASSLRLWNVSKRATENLASILNKCFLVWLGSMKKVGCIERISRSIFSIGLFLFILMHLMFKERKCWLKLIVDWARTSMRVFAFIYTQESQILFLFLKRLIMDMESSNLGPGKI